MPSSAHPTAPREIFARDAAARLMSSRHVRPQSTHRYRRTRTSKVVGRCPNGSCAGRRVTVPRGTPAVPHFPHHGSDSATRHSITARSGSRNCPTASRPSSSRRQNMVRSGTAKVVEARRGLSDGECRNLHPGRPRPLAANPRPASDYTLNCEELFKSRGCTSPSRVVASARCMRSSSRSASSR